MQTRANRNANKALSEILDLVTIPADVTVRTSFIFDADDRVASVKLFLSNGSTWEATFPK